MQKLILSRVFKWDSFSVLEASRIIKINIVALCEASHLGEIFQFSGLQFQINWQT